MPTIIDAFVIELGMDPKKLNQAQKEAVDAFKKTQDQATKSGKEIEGAANKMADSINKVSRSALGLFAVFIGFNGLKNFVGDLIGADAALGRFSNSLGTSPQVLSAWGQAAERFGGSAQATEGTFNRIGKMLFDVRWNAQQLPAAFGQLSAAAKQSLDFKSGDPVKTLTDVLTALQKVHDNASAGGPLRAHGLAEALGIDPGLEAAAYKLGPGITAYVAEIAKTNTPTKQAIEDAQKLQEAYLQLQQGVSSLLDNGIRLIEPVITPIIRKMNDWLNANREWIKSGIVEAVGRFADWIRSIDWETVQGDFNGLATAANEVKDAIGGIKTASEILFGLWAGSKALGMIAGLKTLLTAAPAVPAAPAAAGGLWELVGGAAGMAAGALGVITAGTLGGNGEIGAVSEDKVRARMKAQADAIKAEAESDTRPKTPYGAPLSAAQAASAAMSETTVDGRPVSKANPLPIVNTEKPETGGFWSSVGSAITSFFGSAANAATSGGKSGAGGRPANISNRPLGAPALTGSNQDVVAYIRQSAIAHGIDPEKALRVANHEGLRGFDPTKPDPGGDGKSSFGPFQLHYGGINPAMPHAGIGDDFTKATGLDARDPKNWKEAIDFSMQTVRKKGWSPWMGAKAEGITGFDGVGPVPMLPPIPSGARTSAALSSIANDNRVSSTSTSSSAETTINGPINIHTQATDPKGIAGGIGSALQQTQFVNMGPR